MNMTSVDFKLAINIMTYNDLITFECCKEDFLNIQE